MKKLKYILPIFASVFLFGCSDTPEYPSDKAVEAGTVNGAFVGKTVYSVVDGETVTVEPIDATLSNSFVRGFDASAISDSGMGDYFDVNGNKKDIFLILKQFGINYVRLRVWNNPYSSKNPYDSDKKTTVPGASNKEVVISQVARAKNAGLKVLLDFHYSDYWADPGKQLIPEDWLSVTTSDEMAIKISDYTKEVLNALKTQGTLPDMIQIGNEINSGILVHSAISSDEKTKTLADDSIIGKNGSDNFTKYLKAGIDAAREVSPSSKIMLHLASNGSNLKSYFDKFDSANLNYDIVGLSWYPNEAKHGTIQKLGENIAFIKSTYNKEVIVAETNMNYALSETPTNQTANLKFDDKIYSGILSDSDGNVELSVQNQANIVRAVIETTAKNGGTGVFEWGGEYKGDWKSMFAESGKPLPSLIVFNVEGK